MQDLYSSYILNNVYKDNAIAKIEEIINPTETFLEEISLAESHYSTSEVSTIIKQEKKP